MAAIGRNDPCPCGSGKKYKRCCALVTDVGAQAARVHALDHGVLEKLMPLWEREGFDVEGGMEQLADELGDDLQTLTPILAPFVIYEQPAAFLFDEPDASLGISAPAAILLARYPGRFDVRERAWIENQVHVTTRLWEVTGVERGAWLDVVDVASKAKRRVIEKLGSTNMPLRSGVLARVVDFEGLTVFDGMYPRALGPRGIETYDLFLKKLAKQRKLSPFDPLIAFASAVEIEDDERAQPPALENTDGEAVVPTSDRFTFPSERRGEILAALEALEHCDRDDDPVDVEQGVAHYRLWKPGNRQLAHWDNTILGRVEVRANMVVVRTNSVERADRYVAELTRAFGAIAKRGLRDHEDVMMAANRAGPTAPKPELPAEAREALAAMIRAHEDAWPDSPLPALGGKTPRQALKTKKGRAEVELILREMEHFASRVGEGGMDPQRVREALGL